MPASLIVAVRRAVVAAVSDLPAFADVEVRFAYHATTSAEFAFTTDATFEHDPASMKSGRTFRKEDGAFEFVIAVELPGKTPEEAAERVLELGLAYEEWVADNRNLDAVAAVDWLLIQGGGSLREGPLDQGAGAHIRYPTKYRARLT